MKKTLLFMSMMACLSLISFTSSAQMYISEVLFGPDGDDESNEFIEVRGTPSATIAANTYLVFVEGDDGGSTGKTKMVFDLGGLSFGTNGYLAFVLDGHPYSTASGATIVTSDLTGSEIEWDRFTRYAGTSSDDLIEDVSQNILLVTTTSALSGTGTDIDSDDDGVIDITGWTIHDSISVLDNDDDTEFGYGAIIFTQAGESGTTYDDTFSEIVEIDFKGGYVCRIAESTGSTGEDWFAAGVDDGPYGTIKSNSSDQSFSGLVVTQVGDDSFTSSFTSTSYTSGTLTTDKLTDLTLDGSFDTDGLDPNDFECHNLTISSGQTLTIAKNGSFEVFGSLVNNGGNIVVESGGTLLTYTGKDVATAVFERTTEYDDGRYSFVGSPVEPDADITGDDLGQDVYTYNEVADFDSDAGLSRWEDASSEMLMPGIGYTQNFKQDLSFTGVPNSGTIEVDVTFTVAGSATVDNRGWNLISNPYPAAVDMDDFLDENTTIDGTVYLWDDGGSDTERGGNGDYLAWNLLNDEGNDVTGPNGGQNFKGDVRSMQAFFVHVTGTTSDVATTVEFNEGQRKTGDNDDARFFRTVEEQSFPRLKLDLTTQDGAFSNSTLVGLRNDATLGVDRMYDGLKLKGNSTLQFYSRIGASEFAIQGLPFEAGVSTNLAFDLNYESTELVLNVAELSGLEEGMTFVLTDNLTGQQYDLSEVNSIDVFATNGINERFTVTYESIDVVSSIEENENIITYQFNDGLINVYLKDASVKGAQYSIYDLSGRAFVNGKALSLENGSFNVPVNSLRGLYVLKMQFSDNSTRSIKIGL